MNRCKGVQPAESQEYELADAEPTHQALLVISRYDESTQDEEKIYE
jgi:hypothetical protein